ncbi:MAG: hypothetical protein ABFC78_09360 [Methanoregula sp.]
MATYKELNKIEEAHKIAWKILREERYEALFAERLMDRFDPAQCTGEDGIKQGIYETAQTLIYEGEE